MKLMYTIKALILLVAVLMLTGCSGGGDPIIDGPGPDPTRKPFVQYDNRMVLYGDSHSHSVLSDGDESPDYLYRYARDLANLDWVVLTDHSDMMERDGWVAEDYYRSLPDKYNVDGEFSVLFGYEWTSDRFVHRTVISSDPTLPIYSKNDPDYDELSELWAAYAGMEIMSAAHHVMMKSPEIWWEQVDPTIETCVEFYSKWGLSLEDSSYRPMYIREMEHGIWNAMGPHGRRYGLIAATDTHMSRPGSVLGESRQPGALQYEQPGITGVWAPEHTREAIFSALKDRRCYGMTGTRVDLLFAVNNNMMGSEITSTTPPVIDIKASSAVEITTVSIIKIDASGASVIHVYSPGMTNFEGPFTDSTYTSSAAYTTRVMLNNSDFALCTPVWVDFK